MYKSFGKRVFDIFASVIGMILLTPILFIIIIWIKLSSRGPLFYVQKRVGKDFKEFSLYKFRSMIVDADKQGPCVTSGDDKRITKVGKIIRFGLEAIKGVGTNIVEKVIAERKMSGPFKDIIDFVERVQDKDMNKRWVNPPYAGL